MMTAEFKPDVIEYGRNNADRTDWLEEGFWLPMDKLLHTDPSKIRGAKEISLFYTQSWLTVHYILRDPARRAALYKYLTAIGEGKDRRAAFADAFGMTTLDFQKALRTYMRSGTTYTRRNRASASQPVAMTVTALPGAADDLLLYQAGLRLSPTAKGCRSFEGPVRRAAARHGEDPFALRVRAHSELLCGDRAEAAKILDKLVAAAPGDAELLYLRGMADLRAGDAEPAAKAAHYARAAAWFGRAHKADAAYFPALYRYAQSRSTAKDFLSDNNINVLLLARSIAPQVDEISVDAGRLLMLRDRFDDARLVLAPVAAKTHGGKIAETARTLLAAAEKKEKTGAAMTPFVFPEEE
jgi:tetratricopeptide (TPR) repeat protein